MNTSRSLLGLPNELLAMIIGSDDLTVKDLQSLRLTCKHTKHFASNALGRRLFVDLDIQYTREAFHWYTALLLSDLGGYVRSVSLIVSGTRFKRSHPRRKCVRKKSENKPAYSQLQHLTTQWSNGPVRSWKKVLCGACHLKTLRVVDHDGFRAVFRHTFDKNDELLKSIKSDSLDALILAHLHISGGILKRLLDIHKETLSTLDIKDCILVDGKWLDILDWIRLNLSHLQILCLDVHHEAIKKKNSLYQKHTYSPLKVGSTYMDTSPYTLSRYDFRFRLRLEGQREIDDGLSMFLKAREGDQAR
ncbi:hypothetical protein KCU85_g6183, partial [Aureobasidium melanogenum]